MRRIPCRAALAAALLSMPAVGQALDMDYYVYNGFDEVLMTLQRVALVFADNAWYVDFTIAAVVGIGLGAMTAVYAGLTGAPGKATAWFWPILLGFAIYAGFVVPKGTIHLYDPVQNAYRPVGGIPNGLVLILGGTNLVERSLVEAIDTAAPPGVPEFVATVGGIGFDLVYQATTYPASDNPYLDQSLFQYFHDCLPVALASTAYTTDWYVLKHASDWIPILADLASPSVGTTYYASGADKGGRSVSCTEAWDLLRPIVTNPATWQPRLAKICGAAGFDPAQPARYARCLERLGDYPAYVGEPADAVNFIRSQVFVDALVGAMKADSATVAASLQTKRQMMLAGIGMAQATNEWMPKIRALVISIALGMVPITLLLIATPLMPKALSFTALLFVWLAVWGVTDAMAHGMANDVAWRAFQEIRDQKLGLDAVFLLPGYAGEALGVFGKARSMGILVATFLTTGLFRFGGYALTQIAGGLSGQVERTGAASAEKSVDPAGRAQETKGLAGTAGGEWMLGNFDAVAKSAAMETMTKPLGAQKAAAAAGGWDALGGGLADNAAAQMSRDATYGGAVSPAQAAMGGAMEAGRLNGQQQGALGILGTQGWDPSAHSAAENRQAVSGLVSATNRWNSAWQHGDAAAMSHVAGQVGGGDAMQGAKTLSYLSTLGGTSQTLATAQRAERMETMMRAAGHQGYSLESAYQDLARMDQAQKGAAAEVFKTPAAYQRFLERNQYQHKGQTDMMAQVLAGAGKSFETAGQVDGFFSAAKNLGMANSMGYLDAHRVAVGAEIGALSDAAKGEQMQAFADKHFGGNAHAALGFLGQHRTAQEGAKAFGTLSSLDAVGADTSDLMAAYQSREQANVSVPLSADQARGLHERGVLNDQQYAAVSGGGVAQFAVGADGGIPSISVEAGSRATRSASTSLMGGTMIGSSRGATIPQALMDAWRGDGSALQGLVGMAQNDPQTRFELANGASEMIGQFGSASASSEQSQEISGRVAARVSGKLGLGTRTVGIVAETSYEAGRSWREGEKESTNVNVLRGHLENMYQQMDAVARGEALEATFAATPGGGFNQAIFDREYAGRMSSYWGAGVEAVYETMREQAMAGTAPSGRLPDADTPAPSGRSGRNAR